LNLSRRRERDIEEKEEARRHKKAQPLYDQQKQAAEAEDSQARQVLVRITAEQASLTKNPQVQGSQRVDVMLELQQSYGNKHVQRVMERVQAEKGLGKSLEPETRSEMEASFKQDFGDVRIHADASADELARELGAKAFTMGKDVFFREGAYQPNSEAGKSLLGHELSHVVQQESGIIDTQHNLSDSRSSLETAADAAGRAVASGQSVSPSPTVNVSPVQLQKAEPEEEKEPPKTTKDPKEILGKVLEAASKTDEGKKIVAKLKGALTSEEGIAILSTLAVPTLAIGFAEKMEVPQGAIDLVPKILKFEVGKDMEIALQPIYKGKLGEKPKEWGGMLTFTIKNW
jgi:membrane-associated HD superfamily phosphohydrolase